MKKICLLLAFVLFCCSLTGCDDRRKNNKPLDADKAAEVALSYMNEKYDEEFYVVNSKAKKENGYVPGSIKDRWVDVTVAITGDESEKKYTVQLRLNADKENYDISWDNYMTSIVTPWVKKEMDKTFSKLNIEEFYTVIWGVNEKGSKGNGFTKDFSFITERDSLKTVTDKYDLRLYCSFYISELSYKDGLDVELKKILQQNFSQQFTGNHSGDCIYVSLVTFSSEKFLEVMKLLENGDSLPDNIEEYEIHYQEIDLN